MAPRARVPLLPGVEMDFGGGQLLVVSPLSLGALESLQAQIDKLPTLLATDPAAVRTIIDAAHLALLRNYPELTREQVAELVDVGNMGDVYECVMDVAGIKRRAQRAERDAGNLPAPASMGSAGAASSPVSPPTPAGP